MSEIFPNLKTQILQITQLFRFFLPLLLILNSFTGIAQDTISIQENEKTVIRIEKIRVCAGESDDPKRDLCDSEEIGDLNANSLLNKRSIWVQASVFLQDDYEDILALKISNLRGAQEVYWDGELIGENGDLNPDSILSKIGRIHFYARIPHELSGAGEHLIAVKHKQLGLSKYDYADFELGNYFVITAANQSVNNQMILMLTIFLTSALFFLIFYFGFGRKISFLFLSLYCFSYSIKSILKPYQDFFTPDFLLPYLSYNNSILAANVGSIFLIGFLLWEIGVPRKWQHLLLFGLVSIISFYTLSEVQFLYLLMFWAAAIIAYGFQQKVEGRWWILTGLLGLTFFVNLWIHQFLGYGYFVGIIFFIICMTVSVGQKIARQIKMKQDALLRSATLENQLLKKSIQPHFILNSLASLQELIEQTPENASDFVNQLADEFRLVSKVSNQKLIPIADEIEMCRIHLRIMEYRRNSKFTLKTEGLTGEEKVPPGIFHTLVENGITHGYGTKNEGIFLLSKKIVNQEVEYIFFNDSEMEVKSEEVREKGTGLKYIEARLKETFPKKWKLESMGISNGWQVKIVVG